MSTSILWNGISYTLPATADESWGPNLTAFFTAIPQGALQKTGGTFTLTADANFGANYGLLAKYYSTRTALPSTAGLLRLALADTIGWRNNANSANLLLAVNGSDQLTFGGVAIVPAGITALTGDVTGTGPGSVATTVALIGGVSAANVATGANLANAATDANTVSTIVKRDGSGNFSAGTITANLTGTASLATTVTTNANLIGEATSVGNTVTLTNSAVIAKLLTGYTSGAGTVSASDSILTAIQKLNGNIAAGSLPITTTGDMIYSSSGTTAARLPIGSTNQVLKTVGGIPAWAAAATGGINYLASNPDAEADTSGWATYADAAQNTPVNGTGGSASSTWTRTTSSPLRGVGSFLWTRTAANRQGEGVSFDFTIDNSDQGRTLSVTFDYKIVSGTFFASDGITAPLNDGTTSQNAGMSDLEVFIYDVTNSVLIPVSPQVLTSVSTINASFKGTFQAPSNSTSYRLVIHTARSTSVAFSAAFDNFYVGPQIISYGVPVTDLTQFTPTGTWATNATYTGYWRRNGDVMEVFGRVALSGAPTGNFSFNLPTGYIIDTAKLPGGAVVNTLGIVSATGGTNSEGALVYNSTTSVYAVSNANATRWNATNPTTFANGDSVTVKFSVPIVGWSSSTEMSNSAETRIVAARASATGVRNPTSAKALNYDSVSFDSHSAITVMSGDTAGWKFTAPVSGYYDVSIINIVSGALAASMLLYKNGSSYANLTTVNNTNINSGSTIVYMIAGDYIDVRSDSTPATITLASGVNISIKRLSGPSAIAASESVNARYTSVAGQAITYNTNTIINYDTKDFDSHNSVVTGAGVWKFVAPINGKYLVTALMRWNNYNSTSAFTFSILKNGTTKGGYRQAGSTADPYMSGSISTIISLLAGEYIQPNIVHSYNTTPIALSSDADGLSISIARVGN